MKLLSITQAIACLILFSCGASKTSNYTGEKAKNDSLILVKMVNDRAKAMEKRDIAFLMTHFSDDATFINGAGYFMGNKAQVEEFHNNLPRVDTIGYYYRPGKIHIRMLDRNNALVYYPLRTGEYRISNPKDTLAKNFSLFTISAQKRNNKWFWVAATNQRTAEYFDDFVNRR
jgi:hypothetical protein